MAYQTLIDGHISINSKYVSKIYWRPCLSDLKAEIKIAYVESTVVLRLSINCVISKSSSGALGDASVQVTISVLPSNTMNRV